jgi:hypothetical protein
LTINADFVQMIEEIEGETHTSEEDRENNVIHTQHQEQYGHPSSCEDLDSSEDEFWPEEVLHAPTQEMEGGFDDNSRERREMRSAGVGFAGGDGGFMATKVERLADVAVALLNDSNDIDVGREVETEGRQQPD